jgi:3-oxoacyl-[acyl-carrier-protein] synthase-3
VNAGILGIGSYLPPDVRTNGWWPKHVVASWEEKQQIKALTRAERDALAHLTPGQRRVLLESEALADDPFRGAVERRVMPETMLASQMETWAAEKALDDAKVPRDQIDLLLVQSVAPDFMHVPNACAVHRNLGLARNCHSLATEMVCNAFLQELSVAEAYIRSGRARYALIVQSANFSRFADFNSQGSAWFGDGAAAAVVGPVPDGEGVLGLANATHSDHYGALVTGVPGKRWYDDRPRVYVPDLDRLRKQFMDIPDQAKGVLDSALGQAGVTANDIEFFACHQATPWLSKVVHETAGLTNARYLDTFRQTTSINGANVPFILDVARREGVLRKGQLVALFSGAAGVTVTGALVRWCMG